MRATLIIAKTAMSVASAALTVAAIALRRPAQSSERATINVNAHGHVTGFSHAATIGARVRATELSILSGKSQDGGSRQLVDAAIDAAAIEMAVEIEFQDECAYCWNVMTRTMWPRIRLRLKCISMVLGISIAGVIGYMWVCGSIAVSFGLKPGRCFIG